MLFRSDVQKAGKDGKRILSARYVLEGQDFTGQKCRIFIENQGCQGEIYRPFIVTDSQALAGWEEEELWDTVDESQQAFTSVFKSMYKRTPLEYRQNEVFYPLQLEFALNKNPTAPDAIMQEITYAVPADIPDWMNFIALVIDGFPCLDESQGYTKKLSQKNQTK